MILSQKGQLYHQTRSKNQTGYVMALKPDMMVFLGEGYQTIIVKG
jgi:hypothetical protein